MSKYSGLDKVDLDELTFIENYQGGKIYMDTDGGYSVTKRKFLIDEQFNYIEDARACLVHFNQD